MPLPFFIGALRKKSSGSRIDRAVKRQAKNIEKLSAKRDECKAAMTALEALEEEIIGSFPIFLKRYDSLENKPRNISELSVSNTVLPGFDHVRIREAARDPKWFLSQYISNTGEWMLPETDALLLPQDAGEAEQSAVETEKRIFAAYDYYETLQIVSEQYAQSMESIYGLYKTHAEVLDKMDQKSPDTNWNSFGDTKRFAVQNFVQLTAMLYDMCRFKIADDDYGEGLGRLDLTGAYAKMKTASDYCTERGFEYNGTKFDVVLKGDAGTYFSYCYRLGDRLFELLPVTEDQVSPLLEKLRRDKDIILLREVTQPHARAFIDKLRDIDIKAQRVPSPSQTGDYYAEIITAG